MLTKSYPYILILVLILAIIIIFFYRHQIFRPSTLGNLHTHTTCSDGKDDYETMIQSALKLNFKFIAITDHRFCPDVIQKCLKETRIYCIPGQEVTSNRTHLLALNITKSINPYQPLTNQVAEIHILGGLAIAAHPYAEKFRYTSTELTDSGIDVMECTTTLNEPHPLPCVYTSDAHYASALASQFLSCSTTIKNFFDLKTALLTHLCSRSFFPITNLFRSPSPTSIFIL